VNVGGATTLSGVLAPNGETLAGARVALQARAVTLTGRALSGWSTVANGTTNSAGQFAFRNIRSQTTQQFRAVFTDPDKGAIVSASRRVNVRAVVSLSQPARKVHRGRMVTLRGKLGPVVRGTRVLVKLDGPGRAAKNVRATVTRTGTWSVKVRTPRKTGTWKVVATWGGNSRLLGDRSPGRSFRIVR